jgi:hypothetical protein
MNMTEVFESESFLLPSQVRKDVAGRFKDTKGIKSVELQVKGDAMEGAKEFAGLLLALKKRGAKITHEVSIRIQFPRQITRDKALALVESMPKPKNGSLRVRIEVERRAK